ncbi:MAG TPA: response regulator transcription factor [Candidatus Paceibacterota bacterium]|nr:response regulator transcription factor [Candidatus Paceibacterota bacterium]
MRILIIEDEQEISDFLKVSLKAESFAVDCAADGEKGSYLARTNDYDLIILDNILPKKAGLEVCKEIRKLGKTMPIIILSVRNQVIEKIDLLNAGADDYLTKPFSIEELLARMRALLRRKTTIEQEVLKVGDITLNSKTCIVTHKKKPVHLTRKEFMLLQYLMQNEGAVMSRGMILEHVWDMSIDIFSNTIESHVLSLRKKLDDAKKHEIIQTVSGRGYKIATS